MSAKKGDWVRIHSVILSSHERTGNLPEDTKATDVRMWTKGFLNDESADVGDEVTVTTYTGRQQKGTLTEVNPYYRVDYGRCVPEILYIGQSLRNDLGEVKDER